MGIRDSVLGTSTALRLNRSIELMEESTDSGSFSNESQDHHSLDLRCLGGTEPG
jgi:hypothetical protein